MNSLMKLSHRIITQQERVQAVTALKTIDIDKVIYCTNKIVNEMLERDELLLDLQDMRSHHDATYNHCINMRQLAESVLGCSRRSCRI